MVLFHVKHKEKIMENQKSEEETIEWGCHAWEAERKYTILEKWKRGIFIFWSVLVVIEIVAICISKYL
jgi:hypothetical protein